MTLHIILPQFIKIDATFEKALIKVMKDMMKSDFSTPYFYFIVIILAPIFEELLFRGFLFKGLRESKVGKWGTITTTTAIFAIIHIYNVIPILFLGFLLGLAREKTGSVYVPIAMHALNNFIAMGLLYYVVNSG